MNQTKTLAQQAREEHKGEYAGDFVLKGQKMHEAFTHVNADWLKKTKTFEQMIKEAREFQATCKDLEGAELKDLKAVNGEITVPNYNRPMTPSEHAITQLGIRSGVPGWYLQKLLLERNDAELFDTNVNKGIEEEGKGSAFLRVREVGGVTTLRALLTNRYAVLNNLPVIETLGEVMPGGRVSHLFYNGDTFRANILVPDCLRSEDDSDYGGGISVLNDEIGRFKFRQRPFVFRAICFNGNVWDRKDGTEFSKRHLGEINWTEFRKNIIMNIQAQLPLVNEKIEKVLALKGLPLTQQEIEQTIVYIGQRENLTQKVQAKWYEGFKVELAKAKTASTILSAFGVVQGATRAAQELPFEMQEMLETLSGRLVDGNWEKLVNGAKASVELEDAKAILELVA